MPASDRPEVRWRRRPDPVRVILEWSSGGSSSMKGKMLWFNEVKGLGVIEAETGERVSVLGTAFVAGHVPVGRCKGLEVEFRLDEDEDGYTASAVARAPVVDVRRVRPHAGARVR
jgi:cold shock CspA family protein